MYNLKPGIGTTIALTFLLPFHCHVSLFKFNIKVAKAMNSLQQQREHHH